jgi:hypothetical protein
VYTQKARPHAIHITIRRGQGLAKCTARCSESVRKIRIRHGNENCVETMLM